MATSAALGPDEAVYISDGYNAEVRVFGLDGEHRRTFGRHGDGPGPDGRIWVEVMRTAGNRWEVFDPDGRLLASLPVRGWKPRSVPAFGPDHMVTIRQDSLEIDYVDIWRIDRGATIN